MCLFNFFWFLKLAIRNKFRNFTKEIFIAHYFRDGDVFHTLVWEDGGFDWWFDRCGCFGRFPGLDSIRREPYFRLQPSNRTLSRGDVQKWTHRLLHLIPMRLSSLLRTRIRPHLLFGRLSKWFYRFWILQLTSWKGLLWLRSKYSFILLMLTIWIHYSLTVFLSF